MGSLESRSRMMKVENMLTEYVEEKYISKTILDMAYQMHHRQKFSKVMEELKTSVNHIKYNRVMRQLKDLVFIFSFRAESIDEEDGYDWDSSSDDELILSNIPTLETAVWELV